MGNSIPDSMIPWVNLPFGLGIFTQTDTSATQSPGNNKLNHYLSACYMNPQFGLLIAILAWASQNGAEIDPWRNVEQ